jgi:UDP-N-acetylmuramyl pentapeptide phosphotransferase/UDP-N-acetylglucosamine-1-phosphate transferase
MISVFAIPSITYVAHLKNLLDKPNQRTVHSLLTPRLGGLAIFAGMVSALMIFGKINNGVQHLLAGAIIIYYIGLKDDIVSVSAFKKFFVQILATGIVIFMGDVRITSFQGVLGIYELPVGLSYAFSFLMIIGLTNSINLIDGLDGLAGSIIVVILSTFGFYFYIYGGENFRPFAYVAFSLVGGMVGFLRYNFYKATIFMGDTGSLISGFVIAVLTIQFIEMKAIPTAPSIGIAILFVPMFDTIRVFTLRIMKGVSPFSPDKNHIHHILIGCGMSQVATVVTLVVINSATILFVSALKSFPNHTLLSIIGIQSLILVLLLEFFKRKINNKT